MTFTELCAEVYKLTGRPDKVAVTESAVKAATLKFHQTDYFPKDVKETGLVFPTSEYVQTYDYRISTPLFRAISYMRAYDLVNQTPGCFLKVLTPLEIFDEYGVEKTNICYLAGAYIQIKSTAEANAFIFGYYANPDITPASFDSWIAKDHPFAIVFEAAATVFKTIGKDEESAAYRGLSAEQFNTIRVSNVLAEGY